MWDGAISLLANRASEFHVLQASEIPSSLCTGAIVPWKTTTGFKCRQPTAAETGYVIWATIRAEKIILPSTQQFRDKSVQAMNVKEKFSLLKDVKPDHFYNILGQVIKIVHGSSGKVTMYLSDYTTNTLFYNYAWGEGGQISDRRDGDEYGYTKSRAKSVKAWPGPYGKMTIQLTLYDEHAEFVRENIEIEEWVLLSNVQIKFGNSGGYLEGFLRTDRHSFQNKIQVRVMERAEEPDGNDSRWKEALRRKRDCEKKFEEQKQAILNHAAQLGDKRKRVDEAPSKNNSKKRRQEKRAAAERKAAEFDAKLIQKLNLNENSKLEFYGDEVCTDTA